VFLLLRESGLLEGDYKNSSLYQTSLKLGIIGRPETDEPPPSDGTDETALGQTDDLVLAVEGMWCSSCAWLIEKAVGAVPGVQRVRVLYASDTARISYRPELVSPEQITASIHHLGYSTARRSGEVEAGSREGTSLLLRMGVALFAMMNVMMFSYVLYFGYVIELPDEVRSLFPLILLGFATPVVFWCGAPIHTKALRSMLAGIPTMEVLFSMGIGASYLYSVYSLLTGGTHYYFDTSVSLTALLLVGKYIELSAKQRTSESIRRLYEMLPKKVRIKAPEGERLVSIQKLSPGDRFVVKSGEKIPADGLVLEGRGIVDESLLTGESKPVEKVQGDELAASSMLTNGVLEVAATRIGGHTMVATLISLVEQALAGKSDLEQTVDRITRYFIPAVVVLALSVGGILWFEGASAESVLLRFIAVLVIACPCALGMATPLAVAAGIGHAARRGILIRNGAALQKAAGVDTMVFDKTGTLTEGKFTLLGSRVPGMSEERALSLAASLEQGSNHPIARAFMEAAALRGMRPDAATIDEIPEGRGIVGKIGAVRVAMGTAELVRASGYSLSGETRELTERETASGHTIVYMGATGMTEAGYFVLGDSLRASAPESVARLQRMGLSVLLLSGDMAGTTAVIARRAGIPEFSAGVGPVEKIESVKQLQFRKRRVGMVGDGVNDAPALAQSDLGIAMGTGTDIAMESAPVTLLRSDLTLVPEAILIARRSVRVIHQNLAWAFMYNSAGIVLAVLGLLNPFMAAVAMLASSISVALNSMRASHPAGVFGTRIKEILLPWLEPR
jgi:heavy metal translocating P-type ATPase